MTNPVTASCLEYDATCHCRRCCAKRAWKEGKYANRVFRPRWDCWTPAQDVFLRRLAGVLIPERIAALFAEEFCFTRTASGIRVRIYELGLSAAVRDYTAQQVGYFFGVTTPTVLRWIAMGVLHGQQMQGGVKYSKWLITPEDVEAFISAHPEQFQRAQMPPGRWRQVAEVLGMRDPIYTLDEAAHLAGYSRDYLGLLLARGTIEGTPRRNRKGKVEKWFLKRSQLPQLPRR